MADWTEKYRPSTLAEVRGNDSARDEFREWADTWDDHRKAVVLHGSPGVGKTSAAHALAADTGWDVIELNASDQRTADAIERYAGRAAKNITIGGAVERARRSVDTDETPEGSGTGDAHGRQLIILDEADNVHHHKDRGGQRAITELVKDADQPIVLIANDVYELSRALRNACESIEFRDVSARSILPVLRDICRQEGVEYEDEALDRIAEANSGDLRGAINDLQALAETNDRLEAEDVITAERDREEGIFDFLDALIKEEDAEGALRASYDVDETPDDLIDWIEDNMPKDYHGAELAEAYGALATADRWLGRVRETQNYTFWRYASDAMTAGVAAARREEKGGWTRYGPPSYWSKLGSSRGTRDTRDYVARNIAAAEGTSVGTARREILPYLATMTHHCKNRELTVAMTAAYELDAEHVAFVTGSGEETNKVQSIVQDARELRDDEVVEHSDGAFAGRTDVGNGAGDAVQSDPDGAGREAEDAVESDPDGAGPEAEDDPEATPSRDDAVGGDAENGTSDQQSGLGDFV